MLRVADSFAKSDTGRQRRSNEDSYFERAPVFAVADGMGGARAGEVASRMVVELLDEGLPDGGSDEERLAERVREANARIHERAASDTDRAGMGTTLTAACVGDHSVAIAHVGDSRAYRMRDGELEQITRDHSLVGELVRRGKLTEAEAEDHPQRSVITRALGPEATVDVDTWSYPAQAGDVFLLCSDGLTSMVPEEQIADQLRGASSLKEAGRRLIEEANERGGRDNITVVLFTLEDVDTAGALEQPTEVGIPAPSREQVEAAVAAQRAAPPEETAAPRRTAPLPRREREAPGRARERRRLRGLVPVMVTGAVLAAVVAGAWIASRAVYFVGTDDRGFVTVFRGLPYEGPGGTRLYERFFVSGLPAAQLPAGRREGLLDHRLRSRDDAADLVRQLELGQVGR